MSPSEFQVKTPIFSGPMDLLVYLVRKQEVDLYDLSISTLTSNYLSYLDNLKELDIGVTAEFTSMAAYLLLLKSQTLLPKDTEQSHHKEKSVPNIELENPHWELIRQLIEYKKFKDASAFLENRESVDQSIYPGRPAVELAPNTQPPPLENLTSLSLLQSFQEALAKLEPSTPKEIIQDEEFTVASAIEKLRTKLPLNEPTPLISLLDNVDDKSELIALFLAILELAKINHMTITQEQENNAEIILTLHRSNSDSTSPHQTI